MNTPICEFVRGYAAGDPLRLHMPGHKGKELLGMETRDITEVRGADSLYEADGIIRESEENASRLFGCETLYSTEGSSQCIRAMLYLAALHARQQGSALMARHVQPQSAALRVTSGKVADGGIHHSCSSSALAAATMMAHSIRLRNSRQPYS